MKTIGEIPELKKNLDVISTIIPKPNKIYGFKKQKIHIIQWRKLILKILNKEKS